MGDLRRGIQLANNNPSKSVKKECGEILDKMKQYKEAGELFIKAECWEKGAASYLRAKLLNKVGDIIHRVDSVKIHQAYAKARENEGNVDQALDAYNRAGDHEARIRLLLSKNRPIEAEEIVREHDSTEGANLGKFNFQEIIFRRSDSIVESASSFENFLKNTRLFFNQ